MSQRAVSIRDCRAFSLSRLWVFFSGGEQKAEQLWRSVRFIRSAQNSWALWGSGIYGTPLMQIYTIHSLEMIYCGSAKHSGRFLLCYTACRSSAFSCMCSTWKHGIYMQT